jgi:hypothetical protein
MSPPPINSKLPGSGTVVAKKLPAFEAEIVPVVLVQEPAGQKKSWICFGVSLGILAVKPPTQFAAGPPPPSVAVPTKLIDAEVRPLACKVKMIGEPANTEQDWPTDTTRLQSATADPGETEVRRKSRDECAANLRKKSNGGIDEGLSGKLLLISTPSPTTRQEPGQPKNVSAVPLATSPFHGGPGGVELLSVFQVMLVSDTVTSPAEPVNSVPTTPAEAEGANIAIATAKLKTTTFSEFRIFIIFLRRY